MESFWEHADLGTKDREGSTDFKEGDKVVLKLGCLGNGQYLVGEYLRELSCSFLTCYRRGRASSGSRGREGRTILGECDGSRSSYKRSLELSKLYKVKVSLLILLFNVGD